MICRESRLAELRFGHAFAVVAVTADDTWKREAAAVVRGPWHGVPVFSAWVAQPMDAEEEEEEQEEFVDDKWGSG